MNKNALEHWRTIFICNGAKSKEFIFVFIFIVSLPLKLPLLGWKQNIFNFKYNIILKGTWVQAKESQDTASLPIKLDSRLSTLFTRRVSPLKKPLRFWDLNHQQPAWSSKGSRKMGLFLKENVKDTKGLHRSGIWWLAIMKQ